MLKIKDNVDLKDLEKFGFEKYKDAYYSCYNDYYLEISAGVSVAVRSDTRRIMFNSVVGFLRMYEIDYQNILFDLIQAGLVEKSEWWVMEPRIIEFVKLPPRAFNPEWFEENIKIQLAIQKVQGSINDRIIEELYKIYKEKGYDQLYVISELEFEKFLSECLPKYLNKEELE